jgi:hypothetical protein
MGKNSVLYTAITVFYYSTVYAIQLYTSCPARQRKNEATQLKPPALLDVHPCLAKRWLRAVHTSTFKHTMQVLHNNLYCIRNSDQQVSCSRNLNGLNQLLIIIIICTQHK